MTPAARGTRARACVRCLPTRVLESLGSATSTNSTGGGADVPRPLSRSREWSQHVPTTRAIKKKLTLCRPDVTVREVLDGLAEANGNALWVVELDGTQAEPVKSPAPARASQPESEQGPQPKPWPFLPLQNTSDN
jgi:hypothetical protein